MTQANPENRETERLPDLNEASFACTQRVAKITGISRDQDNIGLLNSIQTIVREAMRAVLPPDDPRRDPDYPFTRPAE